MVFLYFIYQSLVVFIKISYKEEYKSLNAEGVASLEIFYSLLMYRIIYKTSFYRHQYFSLFLLISMGLFKYLIQILLIENIKFDYLLLISILIFPLFHSIFFFIAEKYTKHKYFSPFFIIFIIGVIFTIIGIIMLIICLNIDFEEKESIQILFQKIDVNFYYIIFFIIYCIIRAILFFMKFQAIYNFTIFHFFLYNSFFEFVSIIINMILDYNSLRFILIIACLIEMFAMLVFIEIIELNFCFLNLNLRKNIIFRASSEINSLYKLTDDDPSMDETNSNLNSEENKDDNTSMY